MSLGMPVHLANAGREVTGIPHCLGHLGWIAFTHPAIAQHPVTPGPESRQESGPRGSAGRNATVGVREQGSLKRQPVKVRSLDGWISRGAHTVSPLLISHD